MFRIGEKVHAVDELGRWALGKVVSAEEGRPTVKFFGWDDTYNVQAKDGEIRKPVDYWSYSFAQSDAKRKSRKRKVFGTQLALLKSLCKEDHIYICGSNGSEEVEVLQVDEFTRTVKILNGGTTYEINVDAIDVQNDEEQHTTKSPGSKAKRRKPAQSVRTLKLHDTQSTRNVTALHVPNEEVREEHPKTPPKIYKGFFKVATTTGTVSCGSLCEIVNQDLIVLIREISYETRYEALCWLLTKDPESIDRDVTVSVAVSRLKPGKNVHLPREDKRMVQHIIKSQHENCLSIMKQEFGFRQLVRENDLAKAIWKEVAAAFKTRNQRRTFSFGVCCPEVDLQLFKLDMLFKKRSVYCYSEDSLARLDALLGEWWDVQCMDGQTRFVTQIVFWVRDGVLHATVYVSIYANAEIHDHHRRILGEYINQVNLSVPLDNEDAE